MAQKRKRRTRQEMIADLQAKVEKLQAQEEGTYTPEHETLMSKRIRVALRTRKTALHQARITLNGRAPTENSPGTNGIETKIQNAEDRLASLRETKSRAEEQAANLPFDIERLEDLCERCEKGEDVEMPTDLYRLPGEKTDVEHETAVVAGDGDDDEN